MDDAVLEFLDKGHTREDFLHVVETFRELGMTLHPTFVPFTPWTTLEGYLDLLHVLQEQELIENVAPIQLGIRLLIPEGSRMLELEEVRRTVGPFDPQSLAYPWKNADPRVDALSETVQEIAAAADRQKESRPATFERIWKAAHAAAGLPAPSIAATRHSEVAVPFLSEPWYCCAEPTRDQLVSIGTVKPKTEKRFGQLPMALCESGTRGSIPHDHSNPNDCCSSPRSWVTRREALKKLRRNSASSSCTSRIAAINWRIPGAIAPLRCISRIPEVAAYTVMEALRGQNVEGILALGDRPAVAAAYAARGLGIPYNHPAAVEACRSKLRMREIFRDAGLRVPWFRNLSIASRARAFACSAFRILVC